MKAETTEFENIGMTMCSGEMESQAENSDKLISSKWKKPHDQAIYNVELLHSD